MHLLISKKIIIYLLLFCFLVSINNISLTNISFPKINQIEINTGLEVAAEVYPFRKFWVAENYHQNFKKNNPNHPYIKNISDPRFKSFKFKFEDLIKD